MRSAAGRIRSNRSVFASWDKFIRIANPARLDRSQAITCSNNHSYTPEQAAVAGGLLDNFAATSCDGTSINCARLTPEQRARLL